MGAWSMAVVLWQQYEYYYYYGDIFTQALLMVTCLFFPDTEKDNKGIIMVISTMKAENSFISFLRVN